MIGWCRHMIRSPRKGTRRHNLLQLPRPLHPGSAAGQRSRIRMQLSPARSFPTASSNSDHNQPLSAIVTAFRRGSGPGCPTARKTDDGRQEVS